MRHPPKEKFHSVFLGSYVTSPVDSHIGYIVYIKLQICSEIAFSGNIFNIIPILNKLSLYNEKNAPNVMACQ